MLTTTYRRLRQLPRTARIVRRRAAEGNLSALRQLREIAYLWLTNGITPGYYCAAGLYRKQLSWKQKCDFLSAKKYQRRLRDINKTRYRFVTLNKIITHGVLETFAIPTPVLLGVIDGSEGRTFDGLPLRTAADFRGLVERCEVTDVCFKYVGGWSGHGFQRVRLEFVGEPMVVIQPDGLPITLDTFWNTLSSAASQSKTRASAYGYICQGVVDQHPNVAALHPESLNTARLWLFQAEPGQWEAFAGVLRMGLGTMCVDNSDAGGIFSRIDLATGRLDPATSESPERPVFAVHPTTQVPVEGFVLPMWDQVIPLSARACAAFPYMRLLGIDIAFSKHGPLVVELEAEPHIIHQVGFDRGVRPMLERLKRSVALAATD